MQSSDEKVCLYCQKPGQMSGEHIIADWIKKHVPRYGIKHHEHGFINTHQKPGLVRSRQIKKTISGAAGTVKLQGVCVPCNGGWMKLIQDQAIPVMGPMLEGHWRGVEGELGSAVSLWLMLATLNFGTSKGPEAGITQDMRTAFYQRPDEILPNWHLFAGICSGNEFGIDQRYRLATLSEEGLPRPATPNICVATFQVGQLLLQAVYALGPFKIDPFLYSNSVGLFPLHDSTTKSNHLYQASFQPFTPWFRMRLPILTQADVAILGNGLVDKLLSDTKIRNDLLRSER